MIEQNVYFLGIGGIGMSALARYFHQKGCKVSGYDKTCSPLTKKLEEEGISIHYEDNPQLITEDIDFVVITPAIPSDSLELSYLREKGVKIVKRSEVLGKISTQCKTVAVAGSHGKTTVTALITHLLLSAKKSISAFIGGIAKNIDSNVVIGDENDELVVMEADEFDRSFLHLTPYISIVTSIDADHLDIYGDDEQLNQAFNQFVANTLSDGVVICNDKLNITTDRKKLTYGFDNADVSAYDIRIEDGMTSFDMITKEGLNLGNYKVQLFGRHNVMNVMSAVLVCLQLQIDIKTIKEGLMTFRGVQRRFDIRFYNSKVCYIDDYAHHPEEIKASLRAAREIFPDKKLTLIFQPHLFSRTRDFMDEFAEALSLADSLLLMEIYPARERPIPGITSSILLEKVRCDEKRICQKNELLDIIKKSDNQLVMTMGAGDIDRFVPEIQKYFES